MSTFNDLIEMIKKRRDAILIEIDAKSDKRIEVTDWAIDSTSLLLTKIQSSTEYTRKMREKADKIEDLQLMFSSLGSLKRTLKEKPEDLVDFYRTGVTFVPVQVNELTPIVAKIGGIRTVTFTPLMPPAALPKNKIYNLITLSPADFPQGDDKDKKISSPKDINCPHLEWDHTTASADMVISEMIITNAENEMLPLDTFCRMQRDRSVLSSRPITVTDNTRALYQVKGNFVIKQTSREYMLLFETALTKNPVDADWPQTSGLSVRITACPNHHLKLCLNVRYDDKLLKDTPLVKNEVDSMIDLNLIFVLDGVAKKIHVVNVATSKVVASVSNVVFDGPFWIMMLLDVFKDTETSIELVSGKDVNVTREIIQVIGSLH